MNHLATSALPLDPEQSDRLQQAVTGLSASQLQWVSGYAAGLAASAGDQPLASPQPTANPDQQLTVLYRQATARVWLTGWSVLPRSRVSRRVQSAWLISSPRH